MTDDEATAAGLKFAEGIACLLENDQPSATARFAATRAVTANDAARAMWLAFEGLRPSGDRQHE
jgi:hypothetical protein